MQDRKYTVSRCRHSLASVQKYPDGAPAPFTKTHGARTKLNIARRVAQWHVGKAADETMVMKGW
jgi:hypothetical protein